MLNRHFIWFCVVGGVGFVIDVAALGMMRGVFGVFGARIFSFLTAATVTWLLNRSVTFSGKSKTDGRGMVREYFHYLGIMAAGGIVNYAIYSALAWNFDQSLWGLSAYVAAGSIAGLGVNYLGVSRWLYRVSSAD